MADVADVEKRSTERSVGEKRDRRKAKRTVGRPRIARASKVKKESARARGVKARIEVGKKKILEKY